MVNAVVAEAEVSTLIAGGQMYIAEQGLLDFLPAVGVVVQEQELRRATRLV
jgi:hypothetical protein